MSRRYGLMILAIILIVPALSIALGHLGRHRAEMERLKFYKLENPAGGQDSVFRTSGNFNFSSQWGYPVNQDTFKNHIWVANVFFSTCKSTCPRIMKAMQLV